MSPQKAYDEESQKESGTPLFGALADGDLQKRRKIIEGDSSRMSSAILSPSKETTQPTCANSQSLQAAKKSNAFDVSFYVRQMISPEEVAPSPYHHFKKQEYLNIRDLQGKAKHIQQNKVSDKLSRRDVQYFDLYALQEPLEDYQAMRDEGGFPFT